MDIIDSRAAMERIEELREIIGAATEDDDVSEEGDELTALKALAEEGAHATSEWDDGADLIRDSYFIEYARDFADNIGAVDRNARWPLNRIDWDAANMKITNRPELNAYLKEPARKGWEYGEDL